MASPTNTHQCEQRFGSMSIQHGAGAQGDVDDDVEMADATACMHAERGPSAVGGGGVSCVCGCRGSNRACCVDYASRIVRDKHVAHQFACQCGALFFHCFDCGCAADTQDLLPCGAAEASAGNTILHVWVPHPAPERDSNLHQPYPTDYGPQLPANVLAVQAKLEKQARARGHYRPTVHDLMKVCLEETTKHAFLTGMYRGYDDGC